MKTDHDETNVRKHELNRSRANFSIRFHVSMRTEEKILNGRSLDSRNSTRKKQSGRERLDNEEKIDWNTNQHLSSLIRNPSSLTSVFESFSRPPEGKALASVGIRILVRTLRAKSNLANLVKFKTCEKPYKTGNLTNFANSTNFVPRLAEFVLVGLEDSTAPYMTDKSNFANLVNFETCEKPYKTGNLANLANFLNFGETMGF